MIPQIIPTPAPPMETARLLMRPLQESDAPGMFAIRGLYEVMKWSSKKAPDANLEETEKWVRETFTGPDVAQPPFNFVVIEKNGAKPDRIVGIVGVVFKSDPEVGYIIHPDVWGKGYATEASRRLLEAWNLPLREKENNAEAQDGGERVDGDILHAEIVKGNGGSARVLEKCGFEAVREFHDGGDQIVVFRMMRPS